MSRPLRLLTLLLLLTPLARAADLNVYVTFTNDRAVPQYMRVQVLDHTRTPIAEGFTNDRGQARIVVKAGEYRLRVTGDGIHEFVMSFPFIIQPGEGTHNEYIQVRKIEAAESSMEAAISAARLKIPDKARDEFDKGMEAFGKKKYDEAAKRFKRATELYPQYAAAFTNLGVIAMQSEKEDEAADYFHKAVAADENYPASYNYLAKLAARKADDAEAERLLNKALSLDPQNPDALMLLGVLQYQSGRLDLACSQAKRIHDMPHEGFSYAHYVAGRAFEAKAKWQDAISEFKLYLKETPNGPMADKARAAVTKAESSLALP